MTAFWVAPDTVIFCDTTNSVSVKLTIVNVLLPPAKNGVETNNTVSLV